jgi:hypothetical protein
VKWARGEGVFIGSESSGRPAKVAGTITQQSKGCLIRLGITWRVFQKVAYVRYFWRTSVVLFIEYDCTICRAYVRWGTTVRPY